jgi:ketosteroid isomerase-like protein
MDPTDPLEVVRGYLEAFNRNDVKGMAALCASPMSILDGLAPHTWHGPTATQDWYRDVLAAGEREHAGDYRVTLGEPWHVDVTGDAAYVAVPTTMTFRVHGKQVTQSGSIFTVALRKLTAGWRIAAWAWAKGTR